MHGLLALAWLLRRLALSRRQGRGLRTLDALASSLAYATRAFVIDRADLRFLWTSPPLAGSAGAERPSLRGISCPQPARLGRKSSKLAKGLGKIGSHLPQIGAITSHGVPDFAEEFHVRLCVCLSFSPKFWFILKSQDCQPRSCNSVNYMLRATNHAGVAFGDFDAKSG